MDKEEARKEAVRIISQLTKDIDEYNKAETSLQQHYILIFSVFTFFTGIFLSLTISRLSMRFRPNSLFLDWIFIITTFILILFSGIYFLKSRKSSSGLRALKKLKITDKMLKEFNKKIKQEKIKS